MPFYRAGFTFYVFYYLLFLPYIFSIISALRRFFKLCTRRVQNYIILKKTA